MLDHHALGRAGGAGGVHHVRQVAYAQPRHSRVAFRRLVPGAVVEVDHRYRHLPRQIAGRAVYQQGDRRAVLQHVGETLARVARVQRYISAPRLEDGQQAHHQVQPALDTQGDPRIRLHAALAQVIGQAVGALVELAVSQLLLTGLHRHRVRCVPGMGFEQGVDGLVHGVVGFAGVEVHQLLLQFGRGQHLHIEQRRLGRLHQSRQHRAKVVQQALGTDLAGRLGLEPETAGQVVHRQHQWVAEDVFAAQQFDAGLQHLECLDRDMPVIQQAVEQRCDAAATLGQRQGRLLVGEQGAELLLRLPDRLAHRHPGQAYPQRQGVDEHAQGTVRALTGLQASQQNRTEHHIVTARDATQYLGPRQMKQARRADTQGAGLLAQQLAECVGKQHVGFLGVTAIRLAFL
eukprot:gene10659-biopygen10677